MRRRAGSSRPTGVMVHKGRAGQETRPYKAISNPGDAEPNGAVKNAVGAALCGRPSVLRRGMFPRHPVGASPRLARSPLRDVSPFIP